MRVVKLISVGARNACTQKANSTFCLDKQVVDAVDVEHGRAVALLPELHLPEEDLRRVGQFIAEVLLDDGITPRGENVELGDGHGLNIVARSLAQVAVTVQGRAERAGAGGGSSRGRAARP